MSEHEITASKPLLDSAGNLTEAGYCRTLLPVYSKPRSFQARFHTKEWDYYYIGNPHYALALTIADNGYMGLDSISFLDFDRKWEVTKSKMQTMTMGKKMLPLTSVSGDVASRGKGYALEFQNPGPSRHLSAAMEDFKDGQKITADITLSSIPAQSMVICTPFDKPGHYYFNQKINTMRASGKVNIGPVTYEFDPGDSFATLDWGRGIWTYQNTWYWSSLNADVNGHAFGWNLGYGFGDTRAASENMLFYDGRVHKLDRVDFAIPQKDGRDRFLEPWQITSNDQRIEMRFEPVLDRASLTDALLLKSDQHQVFGRFSGTAVLDDGRKITLDHAMGFAEKVFNRW